MFENLTCLLACWHAKMKNWDAVWHVGKPSWKISKLLARWHAKLNNGHTFDTLLASWHVKMRSWHVLGMLGHCHVDHAGMHATYESVNVTMKIAIHFYDMTTLHYLKIRVTVNEALFWVNVGYFEWIGHYFGWVRVHGALCWVGGGEWECVEKYFG